MDLLSSEMGLERIVSLRRSWTTKTHPSTTHGARCVYAKMDLDWLLLSAAQPESIKMFPLCNKKKHQESLWLMGRARYCFVCSSLAKCAFRRAVDAASSCGVCGEIYAPRASESCVRDEANTRVHACADVLCFDSLRATWRWQKWQFVKKKEEETLLSPARMQTACCWLMLWNYHDFFLRRNTPKHAAVTLPNDWLCCYAAKFNLMKKVKNEILQQKLHMAPNENVYLYREGNHL